MSERFLIREARRREHVFKNLPSYLERIKNEMRKIDKKSRIFLFGSVARGEHALTSDVDVLILTDLKPGEVIARLRRAGFDEPFEFHVVDGEMFRVYSRFARDLREL